MSATTVQAHPPPKTVSSDLLSDVIFAFVANTLGCCSSWAECCGPGCRVGFVRDRYLDFDFLLILVFDDHNFSIFFIKFNFYAWDFLF